MKTPRRLFHLTIGLTLASLAAGCGGEPDAPPPSAVSRALEESQPTSPPGARPSQGTPLLQDPRVMPAISLSGESPTDFELRKQGFPLIHIHFSDRPNSLLGVDGGFTDEELMAGLRHFYDNWQPPAGHPDTPPDLILALQNWGAGASVWDALEELAAQHGVRLWRVYPVVTGFRIERERHPLVIDQQLLESIRQAARTANADHGGRAERWVGIGLVSDHVKFAVGF